MRQMTGKQSISFAKAVYIEGSAAIVGEKEKDGPLGEYFSHTLSDPMCGQESWEEGESELQLATAKLAMQKANVRPEQIRMIFAGDLLAQSIASSFGLVDLNCPLYGLFGACSTMGEALSLGAMAVAGGYGDRVLAVTSSHFGTAEKEFRFPLAYGNQCPKAKGIIHLGATSCYVGDNTDIIVMNEALKLVKKKLVNVIAELAKFADTYKDQPTLAFTHFQPAQPTTVGKRATLWMQEFLMDLEDLEYVQSTLKLLGSKGTTGTQASFLELFDGDQETIDKIDPMIAEKMGFKNCYPVSGQTYSRKVDTRVLNVLAGIAASATKFSNDIRLLQHLKEVEEPFEKGQIGSSAMAYKRNPMRSERIASLSRYVITDALNPAITSSVQWFERTLDDSANKRLSIPEGFLAIDGILDLCMNVVDGLVVYPKVILKHMMAELPFMATENIMMDAVKAGGDRQELHERIRELSMIAGKHVKEEGRDNDLLDLIAADEMFHLTKEELEKTMDPSKYTGRASVQVDAFLKNVVNPVLEANKDALGMTAEINV